MSTTCGYKQADEQRGLLASFISEFELWLTELLTYNIYTSGSSITCSTALWASVQSWMWLISGWLEHSTCNAGRKTGMYFRLFMLEWGWLQQSTWWENKEPPPACCRIEITPFSSISRPVPSLWLWCEANAWAYDVNKHLHCRHACLDQLSSLLVQVRTAAQHWPQGAEMAVAEQRKEVMPQFLWPQPSLYEHVKENCPGAISISPSDVGTMLTILLC